MPQAPTHSNLHWALLGMDGPPVPPPENSDAPMQDDDLGNCAICCAPLSLNEGLVPFPCNHRFHSVCVEKYLFESRRHAMCPLCMHDDPVIAIAHNLIQEMREWIESMAEEENDAEEKEEEPDIPEPPSLVRLGSSMNASERARFWS